MQLYVMREIPGWDQYYLDICKVVAARSKDPNTQIGCVIIGPNHEIRSTGYNSFPRGIRDDVPERLVRPTKYLWIEHAERNAICNAARAGTATEGCTDYVDIMPCMDCARAVVQAGITQVVVSAERMALYSSDYYNEHFGMVEVLFREAKVAIRRVYRRWPGGLWFRLWLRRLRWRVRFDRQRNGDMPVETAFAPPAAERRLAERHHERIQQPSRQGMPDVGAPATGTA